MPRNTLLSLAAVLSAAFIQSAAAQADYRYPLIERSVVISYQDLDLRKPADARIMLDRIEHAALGACGFLPERDRAYSMARQFVTKDYSSCTARAAEQAVARLHAPVVSQIYAERRSSPDVHQGAY